MIIPFSLFLGAIGYFCYKTKKAVTLIDDHQLDKPNEQIIEDDLYRDLEDLFI